MLTEEMDSTPARPSVIIGAILVNKEGRIGLGTSPKWNERYILPGGHIEGGEGIKEALKREVREEIGITIDSKKIAFLNPSDNLTHHNGKKHMVFINCICWDVNGSTWELNEEFSSWEWMTVEQALEHEKVLESIKSSIREGARKNLINPPALNVELSMGRSELNTVKTGCLIMMVAFLIWLFL